MTAAARWDMRDYRRIVSVERRGDALVVLFGDGSWVSVDLVRLLPRGTIGADWSRMTFDRHEIVVPTAEGQIEIPWSSDRAHTDREYSAHLVAAAAEQARQVGLRIRELRESRNLTGKELAERAGIAPQSLSRIEHGHHDVVFTTLQRILAAMGASLKDLVVAPQQPASVPSVLKRLE